MRVPNAVHEAHPWVITRIAPDFRLLDAWALPLHGGRDDFAAALALMTSFDPARTDSAPARALFAVRHHLGRWLGWDGAARRPIPGCAETTLRDRLPAALRDSAGEATVGGISSRTPGFVPLYRTDDEWAGELSNATVHGVLQLVWVDEGGGRYRGRMGVYVKPRGRLGEAYMAVIGPFRHLVVYPALIRQVGRVWEARAASRRGGPRSGPGPLRPRAPGRHRMRPDP